MDGQPEPTFLEFIRYNNWANQMVLRACQDLSPDQLDTRTPGAYGSIRETVEHLIRAEVGYISLLTGERPQPPFDWAARPGPAEMTAYAIQVGNALLEMAERVLPTQRIDREWDGKQLHFQARAVFIQIVDHGIEHRTNITTILNQGIQAPPEVDGWAYLLAHPDRFEPG